MPQITIVHDVARDLVTTNEYDEDRHVKAVTEASSKHGVSCRLVRSGEDIHPTYEFRGTRAQLEAFVIDFYDAGQAHAEDVDFYFE
jgi:hypothetical protein